jgi:RHS repeat-associated protein
MTATTAYRKYTSGDVTPAPKKNASGDFFATTYSCTSVFTPQPLEPHRVTTTTHSKTASGVYYYGYRYYSPELGRWINRDPIGERGGLNVYGFARNRAINIDVLGLFSIPGFSKVWVEDFWYKSWLRNRLHGVALWYYFANCDQDTGTIALRGDKYSVGLVWRYPLSSYRHVTSMEAFIYKEILDNPHKGIFTLVANAKAGRMALDKVLNAMIPSGASGGVGYGIGKGLKWKGPWMAGAIGFWLSTISSAIYDDFEASQTVRIVIPVECKCISDFPGPGDKFWLPVYGSPKPYATARKGGYQFETRMAGKIAGQDFMTLDLFGK